MLPKPEGRGPRIYIPQEQGGPVIPPETGFPFRRLLRLPGLRWLYSTPPPHGTLNYSCFNCPSYNPFARPSRKHRFQQYLYCHVHILCRRNVSTESSPRSGSTRCCFSWHGRRDHVGSGIQRNGANQARLNGVRVSKYTVLPRFIFICTLWETLNC
jgi:hypothetical protein